MSELETTSTVLPALEFINSEHQMQLTNTLSTPLKKVVSLSDLIQRESLHSFDLCGLISKLDTDSEDDSIGDTKNKVIKNEINMKTIGLKKRINNEDIKQKFANLENEHKKIHTQIKSLQNNLMKKEKTVNDLAEENFQLNNKYEDLIKDINEKNLNLIQYASYNKNLEMQLEQKIFEINQLQIKYGKSEQIQGNLMKDIEYYKSELHRLKGQNEQLKDFEELRKKYNEIKRDNIKLGKKFKELKSNDVNFQQKAMSYDILQKKFEGLQSEIVKFRMENKRLKNKQFSIEKELISHQKLQGSLKSLEEENEILKVNIANCQTLDAEMQAELYNLRKGKEHLEKEIQLKDGIINELKEKLSTTNEALEGLKNTCLSTEHYADLLLEQINTYKLKCEALESELTALQESKCDSLAEVDALKEEVKKFKGRLGQALLDKNNPGITTVSYCQACQTEDGEECLNCYYLRQEIEKLGYANLRLHKEKLNLKANFQKLSVKTSKLELKMDELSVDKKLGSINLGSTNLGSPKEMMQREGLIQENLILTKKLDDVIENYNKLLKEYFLLRNDKIPEEMVESSTIIQELQDHISNSQYAITTIEHKLNEEEGKLHASLYHLRTVKNKLSERTMIN